MLAIEPLEDRSLLSGIAVSTLPATGISATGATLNGTVNPEGATATVRFQYSSDPTLTPTVETTVGSGFSNPDGVAVNASGNIVVADLGNKAVKEVLPNGTIKTISSGFNPTGVAVDSAGDVFFTPNNDVEEVLPNGTIKTIGSGFSSPTGVAVDTAGDVFVADTSHNAVKEVLPNGTIKTIGSGFLHPEGVAVDASGDVFVGDVGNNAVKEVLPDGTIKTIGSGFLQPEGVAADASGDVFVGDVGNNAVKEVLPNGTIKTITAAVGLFPYGVAVDASGDVFVTDYENNRVVEFSPPTVAATPSALSGSSATAVSAALTGLTPSTTYYYRVVAASSSETVTGQTVAFTTANNAIPVAQPDTYILSTSGTNTVLAANGVLSNDSTGAGVTAQLVSQPSHGTLVFHTDGSFSYTPNASFQGYDQFTYQDAIGGAVGNTTTVTLLSHQAAVVDKLYHQVLGRSADLAGLEYWTNLIMQGQPYGIIAQGIFDSDERLIPIVTRYYEQFLLRTPDQHGLMYWVGIWQQDGGPENVVAGMISSPEFFAQAGLAHPTLSANAAWVTTLYERLLNREPDAQGLQFWTNKLDTGAMTRPQVVLGFEKSPEAFADDVTSFYQLYLNRNPSPSEQQPYVTQMENGATQAAIQIEIINTTEYQNNPPLPATGTTSADNSFEL